MHPRHVLTNFFCFFSLSHFFRSFFFIYALICALARFVCVLKITSIVKQNQKNSQNNQNQLKIKSIQNNKNAYSTKHKNKKRFYQKYLELRRRINAHSCPVLPATLNTGIIGVNPSCTIALTTTTSTTTANNFTVQRSASLKDYKPLRYGHTFDKLTKLSKCFHFYFSFFFS